MKTHAVRGFILLAMVVSVRAAPAQDLPGTDTIDPPFSLVSHWSVAEWPGFIHVRDGRAVLVGEDSLHILDVSDPAHPTLLGRTRHGIHSAWDIDVQGDLTMVGGWPDQCYLFDLSDPTDPRWLSDVSVPGGDIAYRPVRISDSTAFVGVAALGLLTVSLSDPSAPKILGRYVVPGGHAPGAFDMRGQLAYAAFPNGDEGSDLHVIDLSDPATPIMIEDVPVQGWVEDIMATNRWLSVVGRDTLVFFDLASPRHPLKRGSINLPGAFVVALKDTFAFVATGFDGLRVIDFSDSGHPVEVADFLVSRWIRDVEVEGDLLYVVGSDGLYIVRFDRTSVGKEKRMAGVQPVAVALDSVYPNPIQRTATVSYSLPLLSRVHVSVFDLLGREVAVVQDGVQPAGTHEVTLDGSALRSGVYVLRVEAGGTSQTRTVVLLR